MTIDDLCPTEAPAAETTSDGSRAATGDPLADIAAALAAEFPELSRASIERSVADEADRLREARIVAFVGVLVHKAARERLRSLVLAAPGR